MNPSDRISSRFHRISHSGDVMAVDRKKYFLMGDGVLDPENITGQMIMVWCQIPDHPIGDIMAEIWRLIVDILQFNFIDVLQNGVSQIPTEWPWNFGFQKGLIFWPFVSPYNYQWKPIMMFTNVWHELLLRKPEPVETSSFYISTLSSTCWIASAALIFTLLVCLWMMFLLCPNCKGSNKFQYLEGAFLVIVRLIMNRNLVTLPRRTSFRIFYLSATLFGFILLVSYSALFTSMLSVSLATPEIQNLDDIARLRTHVLCVDRGSFIEGVLLNEEIYGTKFHDLLNGPECLDYNFDAVSEYCRRKIVGLFVVGQIKYRDGSKFDTCIIIALKERLFASKIMMLASKKFPFTKLLNKSALKIKNFGIQNYWEKKSLDSLPSPYNTKKPYQEVTFNNIYGLVLFQIVMIGVSAIVLFIEILHHRLKCGILMNIYNK